MSRSWPAQLERQQPEKSDNSKFWNLNFWIFTVFKLEGKILASIQPWHEFCGHRYCSDTLAHRNQILNRILDEGQGLLQELLKRSKLFRVASLSSNSSGAIVCWSMIRCSLLQGCVLYHQLFQEYSTYLRLNFKKLFFVNIRNKIRICLLQIRY